MKPYEPLSRYAHHRHPPYGREDPYKVYARRRRDWENREWNATGFGDATMDAVVQPTDVLDAIADNLASINRRDLTFLGPPGTGKTHLSVALLYEHHFAGRSTSYVSALDLEKTSIDALIAPEILVIDDLGVERDTPTHDETMFRIIDGRWRRGFTSTVISSNLDHGGFIDRLGPRNMDRLAGPTIVLDGPSRRRTPLPNEPPQVPEMEYALAASRRRIGEDDALSDSWARLLVAEGLYELLDANVWWVLDDQCARLENVVRYLFGDDADEIISGDDPAVQADIDAAAGV